MFSNITSIIFEIKKSKAKFFTGNSAEKPAEI